MYKQKQQLRDSYILHIYTCYKNILYTHTMFWYMVQLTLNARLYTHELFLRNLSTCMLAYLIKACVYIYIYTCLCTCIIRGFGQYTCKAHLLHMYIDVPHQENARARGAAPASTRCFLYSCTLSVPGGK